jgi:hypothetical protein
VLLPICEAVIVHCPTPVVVPLVVHGPADAKVIASLELDDALNENVLPYCTFPTGAKVIVCDCRVEPAGSIVNDSDTEFAAS